MGVKTGETWYWTSNIITVYQGDNEHCGGQIKSEMCAAIADTYNKW